MQQTAQTLGTGSTSTENINVVLHDAKFKELPNGAWNITTKICTFSGSKINARCIGIGNSKEEAMKALLKDIRETSEAVWA